MLERDPHGNVQVQIFGCDKQYCHGIQWAGKGTTSIPEEYMVLSYQLFLLTLILIPRPRLNVSWCYCRYSAAAVAAVILLIVVMLWWKGCLKKSIMENGLRGLDLQTGSFTLRELKAATNNFDPVNKFGKVVLVPFTWYIAPNLIILSHGLLLFTMLASSRWITFISRTLHFLDL